MSRKEVYPMNFGHFDLKNKEYVITNPATPYPWANYLGSPEYGAIISNNAGGYSFVKSGANGRVIRYRFNGVANDTPGRYVYIRDAETGDYWSASWLSSVDAWCLFFSSRTQYVDLKFRYYGFSVRGVCKR